MKNLWLWIVVGLVGLVVAIGIIVKIGSWLESKTSKPAEEALNSPYAFLAVEATGGYRTSKASPGFVGTVFPNKEELTAKSGSTKPTIVTRTILGVESRICIWGPDENVNTDMAERAFNRIDELAPAFDITKDDSEIWMLNRSAGNDPVLVSEQMMTVIKRALVVAELSDGFYDPTDGPLALLWQQTLSQKRPFVPDDSAIQAARARVGYKSVRINDDDGTVALLKPDMIIELTGIAKGFLADEGVRYLDGEGVAGATVEIGRSIATLGHKPDGTAFHILVDNPLMEAGDPVAILEASGSALSSVGIYGEFVTIRGQRFSGIVDPKNGMSMAKSVGCTATGPDAMTCEALASAIFVMGPDPGRGLVQKMNRWYQEHPVKKR